MTDKPAPDQTKRRILLALLLSFAAARLILIAGAPTQLYHPEEYVNLRLAAAVYGDADLWPAPPQWGTRSIFVGSLYDYQYQDFDGGTLAVSLVLVPLAGVFGLTAWTVKLGALLWAFGALLAWLAVAHRLFGDDGRLWLAGALVVSPAPQLIMSCIHWGNHAESVLFPPLIILLLLTAGEAARRRAWVPLVFGAGAIAGFGIWFSLLNLLPVALILVLLPLALGIRALAGVPIFLAGGALGFRPWIGRNFEFKLDDFGAQGTTLRDLAGGTASPGSIAEHLDVLLTRPRYAGWDLPGLWSWSDTLQGPIDAWTRAGIAGGAIVAILLAVTALKSTTDRSAVARRLYVALIAAICLVALPVLLDMQLELKDRRLAPAYVFGQVVVGLGLASIWSHSERGRMLAIGAAALLLIPNAVGQIGLVTSWDRPDDRLQPWLHFALPTRHPRDRFQAGVPTLTAHELPRFNRVLDHLLTTSNSNGRKELEGFRIAFASGTAQNDGPLVRSIPDCPGEDELGKAGAPALYTEQQATALGMGLAVRCTGSAELAADQCEFLPPDLQASCREGVLTAPR